MSEIKRLARLPLVPSYNSRGSSVASLARDQRIINAIITRVPNQLTGSATAYLQKRQGIESLTTQLVAKKASVLYVSPSTGSSVIGFDTSGSDTDDLFYDATDIGNPTGIPVHVSETIIAGTTNILLTTEDGSNATRAYFYPVAGSLTQITDGDFPTLTCGPLQELDGRVFIMTQAGDIYQSDSNSVSAWTAGTSISANRRTDKGRGLMKQGDFIVAFGTSTIEFFYNAGNASGSVLSRAGSMSLVNIGASACGLLASGVYGNSVLLATACSGHLFFVGSGEGQQNAIYELVNGRPEPISTPVINNLLTAVAITEIDSFNWWGQTMLYIGAGTTIQLLYSLEMKQWYEVSFSIGGVRMGGARYFTSPTSRVLMISTTSTSGIIFNFDTSETFQDNGGTLTMTVQISDNGMGTDLTKFVTEAHLVGDTQASGTTSLAYSDDDGQNFVTHDETFDMTAAQKKITGLGSYEGTRLWKLTHTANTAWRGQFLDLYGQLGNK